MVQQAGQTQSGDINPMMSGLLAQYMQLPMETLQELSARAGTSQSGSMIRRALQMKKMNPQMGMQQQNAPSLAGPQAPMTANTMGAGMLNGNSPLAPGISGTPMMGSMADGGAVPMMPANDSNLALGISDLAGVRHSPGGLGWHMPASGRGNNYWGPSDWLVGKPPLANERRYGGMLHRDEGGPTNDMDQWVTPEMRDRAAPRSDSDLSDIVRERSAIHSGEDPAGMVPAVAKEQAPSLGMSGAGLDPGTDTGDRSVDLAASPPIPMRAMQPAPVSSPQSEPDLGAPPADAPLNPVAPTALAPTKLPPPAVPSSAGPSEADLRRMYDASPPPDGGRSKPESFEQYRARMRDLGAPTPTAAAPEARSGANLGDIITQGESQSYNSYNRGRAGDSPEGSARFDDKTVGDVMNAQRLGIASRRIRYSTKTLRSTFSATI